MTNVKALSNTGTGTVGLGLTVAVAFLACTITTVTADAAVACASAVAGDFTCPTTEYVTDDSDTVDCRVIEMDWDDSSVEFSTYLGYPAYAAFIALFLGILGCVANIADNDKNKKFSDKWDDGIASLECGFATCIVTLMMFVVLLAVAATLTAFAFGLAFGTMLMLLAFFSVGAILCSQFVEHTLRPGLRRGCRICKGGCKCRRGRRQPEAESEPEPDSESERPTDTSATAASAGASSNERHSDGRSLRDIAVPVAHSVMVAPPGAPQGPALGPPAADNEAAAHGPADADEPVTVRGQGEVQVAADAKTDHTTLRLVGEVAWICCVHLGSAVSRSVRFIADAILLTMAFGIYDKDLLVADLWGLISGAVSFLGPLATVLEGFLAFTVPIREALAALLAPMQDVRLWVCMGAARQLCFALALSASVVAVFASMGGVHAGFAALRHEYGPTGKDWFSSAMRQWQFFLQMVVRYTMQVTLSLGAAAAGSVAWSRCTFGREGVEPADGACSNFDGFTGFIATALMIMALAFMAVVHMMAVGSALGAERTGRLLKERLGTLMRKRGVAKTVQDSGGARSEDDSSSKAASHGPSGGGGEGESKPADDTKYEGAGDGAASTPPRDPSSETDLVASAAASGSPHAKPAMVPKSPRESDSDVGISDTGSVDSEAYGHRNALSASLLCTVGIWDATTTAHFGIQARSAAWCRHADPLELRAAFARQTTADVLLFWQVIPGGILVSKIAEYANDEIIFTSEEAGLGVPALSQDPSVRNGARVRWGFNMLVLVVLFFASITTGAREGIAIAGIVAIGIRMCVLATHEVAGKLAQHRHRRGKSESDAEAGVPDASAAAVSMTVPATDASDPPSPHDSIESHTHGDSNPLGNGNTHGSGQASQDGAVPSHIGDASTGTPRDADSDDKSQTVADHDTEVDSKPDTVAGTAAPAAVSVEPGSGRDEAKDADDRSNESPHVGSKDDESPAAGATAGESK